MKDIPEFFYEDRYPRLVLLLQVKQREYERSVDQVELGWNCRVRPPLYGLLSEREDHYGSEILVDELG